jgi:hypothetical protein
MAAGSTEFAWRKWPENEGFRGDGACLPWFQARFQSLRKTNDCRNLWMGVTTQVTDTLNYSFWRAAGRESGSPIKNRSPPALAKSPE